MATATATIKATEPIERGHFEMASGRDLKIDIIRGLAMVSLVTTHIEFFSLYNLIFWERIGVVSGAEGFVLLSGLVIGMVYKRHIAELGWDAAIWKLLRRAAQLWRVNVAVIFSVALLNRMPYMHVSEIMTFIDRGETNQVYLLFPEPGTPPHIWIMKALLLQIGPHQFQILGMYVFFLAFSPLSLYLMSKNKTLLLLTASWTIYFFNWWKPSMPTGCQFEWAFPLLTWQLLYFHGQALGYHRQMVFDFFRSRKGHVALVFIVGLFLAFMFWAQNAPDALIPSWIRPHYISAAFYEKYYNAYMQKGPLGIARVFDSGCVLVVLYLLLSRFWQPIHRAVGWFLEPIGQSSLYVYILHVYFVALVSNILPFGYALGNPHFWLHTLACTLVLACLWTMVRYRVLFRWIPR